MDAVHVLMALPVFHPFYSGAAERFRRYLPGMRARGMRVTVFTGTPAREKDSLSEESHDWRDYPEGALLPMENMDGVPVHRVRLPDADNRRRASVFARALARHCRNPRKRRLDVVQLFTPAATALPDHWSIRRAGISLVGTRTLMPDLPQEPIQAILRRASIRFGGRAMDCQTVGSRAMLQAYRQLGVRGPVEVIPHGVDTERFRPPRGSEERMRVRRRLRIPETATVLLFCGAMTTRKGAHRLLAAWRWIGAAAPQAHLVLLGERRRETSPSVRRFHATLDHLARESGAGDRLHFPGLVENIEDYFRAADVFVFPSEREGFPNAMLEAMASGVPVVCSPFDGLSPELGKNGKHYVLSSFEPQELARDVLDLIRDKDCRKDMGLEARRWILEHLDVDDSIEAYSRLYRRLAARKRQEAIHP